ncbi:hypothetical protein CRG98_008521, partial [Punica granatum]
GPGPTADPTPWAPPIQAPENVEAPAPPTLYTSTVHPFTSQFPPPSAPSVVPLPSAAFLSAEHILSAPPPVSTPAPAMIYTAPPPTVFPATTAPAPTHPQATELPPYPTLQPHVGLSYQAPPPINTTFHEPGTPTHAAQFASPTHFFPEADAEQERRLKRVEETIRALQANDVRSDARYGDCSLFPGMRLPPKFKAEDIPTWEDLSRKFTDQYRYCAETPPTLLELSTKEMTRGQRFEEYAAKWRAQATKHILPISEVQQIQLFHSTLRGVYYSHLLAHTSSFSDLIEAGKKLDLGIKLVRMEDPTSKGDESSKKAPTTSSSSSGRRGKEVTVNAVNTAQQVPQQYSMNYTAAPPTAPSYAPQAPQYWPQASTQPIYYSALPPPPSSALTQRVPPPQGQQGGAAQPRPRRQYPALPVPLSHIYRQIREKVGTIAPGPRFDPTIQDQSKQCEYHRVAVGFTGVDAPYAPLVIDVPARDPYSNDRVPWTYEGSVGDLERQFGVMGITRSGRLYENPTTTDRGKAPVAEEEMRPRTLLTSSKKVTEEEAEAFMKVIKAKRPSYGSQRLRKSPRGRPRTG